MVEVLSNSPGLDFLLGGDGFCPSLELPRQVKFLGVSFDEIQIKEVLSVRDNLLGANENDFGSNTS